jgi:hypothetical protein
MEIKKTEKKNDNIKLNPLKFEDMVKDMIQVKKPLDKGKGKNEL